MFCFSALMIVVIKQTLIWVTQNVILCFRCYRIIYIFYLHVQGLGIHSVLVVLLVTIFLYFQCGNKDLDYSTGHQDQDWEGKVDYLIHIKFTYRNTCYCWILICSLKYKYKAYLRIWKYECSILGCKLRLLSSFVVWRMDNEMNASQDKLDKLCCSSFSKD